MFHLLHQIRKNQTTVHQQIMNRLNNRNLDKNNQVTIMAGEEKHKNQNNDSQKNKEPAKQSQPRKEQQSNNKAGEEILKHLRLIQHQLQLQSQNRNHSLSQIRNQVFQQVM